MADQQRPDTSAILAQLKDFQRDTVEHVFRRLYLDPDFTRRYLIADEVGLGKTLVARGVIAKAIEYLWDPTQRIDILYVCSNTDIARQNISRLNVTDTDDFALSSRITLLPITVHDMQRSRLNFISFTPGTSFEVQNTPGWSTERMLLYWLLEKPWQLSFNSATRVLQGTSRNTDRFRNHVKKFRERHSIHTGIAEQFAGDIAGRSDLRERFDAISEQMPRAGADVPQELHRQRNRLIGELRRLLAETCLHWLEPDLIILDEFQRFKELLCGSGEDAPPASQLAHHLFNYQESQDDPRTAARVLLLSATPYKMYTLSHESEQDDHYGDFRKTLDFLANDEGSKRSLHDELGAYRQELFRLADSGTEGLVLAKQKLEHSLRKVMVRTERLALSSDRNGMLSELMSEPAPLRTAEVEQYLSLQQLARLVKHDDVLEYWKSAPYLLNFMEDYDLKRKVNAALDEPAQGPALAEAVGGAGLLQRKSLELYRELDLDNARLRHLHRDLIGTEAWRLLWMPPSLPYYQGAGAFANPKLANFTKRLVFSCWRVVPKAIAAVLSYEAERRMIQSYRKKARNTAVARKKRRPLLRFTFRKGSPTGMPVLAMIYPCRTFADRFDPLRLANEIAASGEEPTRDKVVRKVEERVAELLEPHVAKHREQVGPPDEAWYWVAPLLIDRECDPDGLRSWFEIPNLEQIWAEGAAADAFTTGRGWRRHVERARDWALGHASNTLGPPPKDLAHVLALLAIGGPGVAALRALERVATGVKDQRCFAAPLAHAFLHLFNLPEVTAMLRDRENQVPYWQSVLNYCADGNLQATLDEYAHVLVESLGLIGKKPADVAKRVTNEIERCLRLRTSTAQADMLSAKRTRVRRDEPVRFRTRFAMRFGDQEAEDSSEPTRADLVRASFNSPFWPFVLATTSVGQEGLDFHTYCHAVVHWNLPSNPVDLEQREGRVHRYKGHAVRKNLASSHGAVARQCVEDPWASLFAAACESRPAKENDLFPYWLAPVGPARIERHIPCLPHSRDLVQRDNLRRALVLYRMVFGQNRQEDIVNYLLERLSPEEAEKIMALCRIDLSAPRIYSETNGYEPTAQAAPLHTVSAGRIMPSDSEEDCSKTETH